MLHVIFRTIVIFLFLLFLMRLLGKRQMGELELSELVVSILIADLAAVPLQDPELSLLNGLVPTAVLFLCELLLSTLALKSMRARRWLCGKPCFLIVNGVIQQKNMRKSRFTMDELCEELRNKSITDPAQVQYAVLETDGALSLILAPEARPVTAAQMNAQLEDDGYATILIEDGKLLRENLTRCGKDMKWLKAELTKRGCASFHQVYAMLLFRSGKIYFAEKF